MCGCVCLMCLCVCVWSNRVVNVTMTCMWLVGVFLCVYAHVKTVQSYQTFTTGSRDDH